MLEISKSQMPHFISKQLLLHLKSQTSLYICIYGQNNWCMKSEISVDQYETDKYELKEIKLK